MQQKNVKLFIYPLISLGIFIVLVFGAAYAYIAGTITMNTANYQVVLPSQTSLVCTKTDCSVSITPSQMSNTNTSSSDAKSTDTCAVNCTCSGTPGAKCNYDVTVLESAALYIPSTGLGANNEFTVKVTSPAGCTTQNGSSAETQTNTQRSKIVSSCSLEVPAGGSVSANVTAEFKWYNLNIPQDGHALKTYKYQLSTRNKLPDTYQEVEYIESNGTQYIDTLEYAKNNMRIELDMKLTSADGDQKFFGSYGGSGICLGTLGNKWRFGNSSWQYNTGTTTNSRILVVVASNNYMFGGSAYNSSSNAITANNSHTMLAMGIAYNGSVFAKANMRLYNLKIFDNGSLIRDYVPCYLKNGGTIGLYDMVTGTFIENAGTGTFTKGNDI